MKTILKVFGILLGLILVVFAALVVYISTIDPNDYKGFIADTFREETGRTLTIDGDINVTVYPWLGLELNGVTIGNAPGFGDTPFLHTDHALVRAKLMPLLQEQYEIDTVRVHGLAVNLMKDESGRTNWEDLVTGEPGEGQQGQAGAPLAALVLGGVDIRDASFTWDDRSTGKRYAISNMMMTTGELVFGEPIDMNLTLDAVSSQPELAADVSFTSTLSYNLDDQIYDIAPMDLSMVLTGPNVPQGSTDITLRSGVRINLDEETLAVNDLDFNALGSHLTGTVNAGNIMSEEPSLETDINLTGNDLALLFKVAEIEPLATQLAGVPDRSFSFNAAINADMDTNELEISGMQASMLGANFSADIRGQNIRSDTPAVQGTLNASGPDLPTLLQVLGQLQGGADSSLSQLAVQLKNSGNRAFNLSAEVDADMADGDLNVSGLQASLLGAQIKGEIEANQFNTSTPIVRGNLNATGPNLPSLMQLLGQVQGGEESPLAVYGRQLGGVSNKAFVVDTRFDANMTNGDINVPQLSIDALGIKINGNLVANNMQNTNGTINGQLAMSGTRMGEILTAVDQADLGEVLQSMNLNAAINGTRTDLNVSPLDLKLVFSGAQIPNSPVDMTFAANTRLNLEQETFNLNNLRLSGLGLNVTGNINAEQIFDVKQYKGDIEVAPFSLRRLMRQLNQDPPATTDNRAYENVALSTAFDGSSSHLNITRLAMVLDESKLDGTLSVTDFENPATRFAINIDQINADRYLPPQAEGDQRPVTPETAAGAATQLPLETLRSLNTQGELKVGQLVISNARVSDVVFGMNAKDGRINFSPVSANLYEGSYKGDISLDATTDTPVMSVDSALTGVNINPLMMDVLGAANVSGTGNVNLKATAQGIDSTTMIRNLNGTGRIVLEDGVLQGVDVARVLAQVEIMIRNRQPRQIDRGEQTPFDSFSSTLDIRNGVVSSNDLQISSPGVKVTGKGTIIDLNSNIINYDLIASADQATATRGEEQYNIGGYSIPIKCSGNANSPSCLPNVERIISEVVQREVQKQIGNVLQRALGGEQGAGQTQQQQQGTGTGTQQQQTQPQQEQTQPADPGQELLNKALEGIFNRR